MESLYRFLASRALFSSLVTFQSLVRLAFIVSVGIVISRLIYHLLAVVSWKSGKCLVLPRLTRKRDDPLDVLVEPKKHDSRAIGVGMALKGASLDRVVAKVIQGAEGILRRIRGRD